MNDLVIRQSHLQAMRACPTSLWFDLHRTGGRRNGPMFVGSMGHETLERNFKHKLLVDEDLPRNEFLDDWEDRFDKGIKEEDINWQGMSPIRDFKDPVLNRLLPDVHSHLLPQIAPTHVEEEIHTTIPGLDGEEIPIKGTVDLVALDGVGNRALKDFKFRGKTKRRERATDQLVMYSLLLKAADVQVDHVSETALVYKKVPEIQPYGFPWNPVFKHDGRPSNEDAARVLEVKQEIQNLHRQITLMGEDPLNWPMTSPEEWKCSEKYCKWFSRCPRGGGNYL